MYGDQLNADVLKSAFNATCIKRGTTNLIHDTTGIVSSIESDNHLRSLWTAYQNKFPYASDMSYEAVIDSLKVLCRKLS